MELIKTIQNIFASCDDGWKEIFAFSPGNDIIDVGWQKTKTIGTIMIPADKILGRIRTRNGLQIMPLEKTPHYRWLKDILLRRDDTASRNDYYEYSRIFFPDENPNEQLQNIKKMALEFQAGGHINTAPIVTFIPSRLKGGDYTAVLYDGTHRTAIARILGHKRLKCYVAGERI